MQEANQMEYLIREMAALNEFFWPWHIVVTALALTLALGCRIRPGSVSSRSMLGFLSALYLVIAYGIGVCALHLKTVYYLFTAGLHGAVALLFIVSFFQNKIRFGSAAPKGLKILSGFLIVYGLFLYHGVELLMGYTWPGIFTFGALRPTSIFAIGVLIEAAPTAPSSTIYKMLLGSLSFGAVVCAGRAVLIGGLFDISYLISGLIGFYVLFRYQRPFRRPALLEK